MKAQKALKIKAPKKAERIVSQKDVIGESFIALFRDDLIVEPSNLYHLFDLKKEALSVELDLHDGKLYLFDGNTYRFLPYEDFGDYLKQGGKGAGKYKHLSEKNWQSLTDKKKAQALFDIHHPQPVERIYPVNVTPPDFEAYYISIADESTQRCVYLRNLGAENWRIFYAAGAAGLLGFEAYACSEYVLHDILLGKDRRSKAGQIDCCDRLLEVDEVQYLSAFMPNEHALKRSKGQALCEKKEGTCVLNAYYWKNHKCVPCADEAYILSLFEALSEIARFSVELEFAEEDADAEDIEETEDIEDADESEDIEEIETPHEETVSAAEEPLETEDAVQPSESQEEADTAETDVPTPAQEDEAPQDDAQESIAMIEEDHTPAEEDQAAPTDSMQEDITSTEASVPIEEQTVLTPVVQEDLEEVVVSSQEAPAEPEVQKAQKKRFSFFKRKNAQKDEVPEAPAAEEQAEEVPEPPEEPEASSEIPKTTAEEVSAQEPEDAQPVEKSPAEEVTAEAKQAPAEETSTEESESAQSANLADIPTDYSALAQEVLDLEFAEPAAETVPEAEIAQKEAAQEKTEAAGAEEEASPEEADETAQTPTASEENAVPPEETETSQEIPEETSTEDTAQTIVSQVQTAPQAAKEAFFELPRLISAYAVAGRKKAKIKAEIIEKLSLSPLIVPITALHYQDSSIVYISKRAYKLCGKKILLYTALADKTALTPEEDNKALREGVMVKTVVNRTKAYIPVFTDFKTAEQLCGTKETFGVFTLGNLLSHIRASETIEGISINPGVANLKLSAAELEKDNK